MKITAFYSLELLSLHWISHLE